MKVIPIVLTLLLTGAWAYTSWYWYTCNIKWFCGSYTQTEIKQVEKQAEVLPEVNTQRESTWSELESIFTSSWEIEESVVAPKLSSEDVLLESQVSKEKNIEQVDINITVGSWAISETETETGKTEENQETKNIAVECNKSFTWPISFWWNNNTEDVKFLEKFLLSQGENIQEDGIYGQEEFDAMKRFQLKYKTEILDPWDIELPTGYVGKTTIKKIQSLTCQ